MSITENNRKARANPSRTTNQRGSTQASKRMLRELISFTRLLRVLGVLQLLRLSVVSPVPCAFWEGHNDNKIR